MNRYKKTLPLLFACLLFSACSAGMIKPELAPEILTSAPYATNLRQPEVPEDMTPFEDLSDLKLARLEEDPALGEISEIPILGTVPAGLKAAYSVNPEELLVTYEDPMGGDRSIVIYGTFSEDAPSLLTDISQGTWLDKTKLGSREFYLLTAAAGSDDKEAYTLADQWFIQVSATGFTEAEFQAVLRTLKIVSLI